MGYGPNLLKGQSIKQCFSISIKVSMTSSIGQLTTNGSPSILHLVMSIYQFLDTHWQNLNAKLVGKWKIEISSKSTNFLSFWQPQMKNYAYKNNQSAIQPCWCCWLTHVLCQHPFFLINRQNIKPFDDLTKSYTRST